MKKRTFTLIGYPLSHSFSEKYFTQKFEKEGIQNHEYSLSPLSTIEDFPSLIDAHPDLVGLNVTIPYKEQVIPFLDKISDEAKAIGAVNTIKKVEGKLLGFNTDVYGFEKSLVDLLGKKKIESALVLGTGGAAKAIVFVLKKLGIQPFLVSRKKGKGDLTYEDLEGDIFEKSKLIVNTTPLGMSPKKDTFPKIPYDRLNENFFLYDLVYNPEKTVFLKKGNEQGAAIKNGLEMLHLQADKAWEIWNEPNQLKNSKHTMKVAKSKKQKNTTPPPKLNFSNTEIAFGYKSDKELKKAAWLFSLMNKTWLVNPLSNLGMLAMKLRVPFTKKIVRETMFTQFVGGRTLLECTPSIEKLYEHKIQTVLDYGAEAKETEKDFNKTMNENIRAIEFASANASTPVISTKITGLARFELLETIQKDRSGLPKSVVFEYRNVLKRLDAICHAAQKNGVAVMVDAEESWIQEPIDHLVDMMMKRYNRKKVVVYNTFQMYRHDRLQFLFNSFNKAEEEGYLIGAKLVRGAYMEKENNRAEDMEYPTPIQPNKQAADDAYNMAVRFCVDNYKKIASCAATHNAESCLLQAQLIHEKGIKKNHPHLNFCQLYGMSDNLTFNLAAAGYNASKYVVYGQVNEVFPYLVRRAKENTAVSGDMSREYALIKKEMERRGL